MVYILCVFDEYLSNSVTFLIITSSRLFMQRVIRIIPVLNASLYNPSSKDILIFIDPFSFMVVPRTFISLSSKFYY